MILNCAIVDVRYASWKAVCINAPSLSRTEQLMANSALLSKMKFGQLKHEQHQFVDGNGVNYFDNAHLNTITNEEADNVLAMWDQPDGRETLMLWCTMDTRDALPLLFEETGVETVFKSVVHTRTSFTGRVILVTVPCRRVSGFILVSKSIQAKIKLI
jgi:hypothetical protein